MATEMRVYMRALADRFKAWRRRVKSRLPWVRRRHFRDLEKRYQALVDGLHEGVGLATSAPIVVRKSPGVLEGDVCLFVTHAPRAHLKEHVAHHLSHLLRRGLQVVLVANTDVPLSDLTLPPALEAQLAGVMVRANAGFDFGAWAHAITLCDRSRWTRLFLVNDSIVGPLDAAAFDRMMGSIDASGAAIVGLTENPLPLPHLQSFFLVFSAAVLRSEAFAQFVSVVLNFADKGHVVDVYEVRLTRALRAAGFTTEAMFPDLPGRKVQGDFLGHWEALLAAGFPYVKTRVLQEYADDPRIRRIRAAGHVDDQV